MKIIKYDSFFGRDVSRVLDTVPYSEKTEISLLLDSFPENGYISYSLGTPTGIACSDISPGRTRAVFHIFVMPSYRLRGAGSALFSSVYKQACNSGIQNLFCGIEREGKFAPFAEKLGMKKKYSSDFMTFHGEVPQSAEIFEKYNDSMFFDFVNAEGAAFLPVRLRTGAEPARLAPTQNVRSFLSRAADDYFVLRHDGRIIAGAGCHKGEISDVFVSEEFRGQGIGGKLIERCVYHCDKKGYSPVFLNVVSDNNHAVSLYRSLGFVTEKTTDYYVKTVEK
ncbi:MAG: GNAT family N-acetyltransferase [Clostridia bacterium]|nr:GNAT family N-acetyltransferase [Clostridia bacterium]MBR5721731.1 GNAT family N-acetyltransferase [Clostridia bacterium]